MEVPSISTLMGRKKPKFSSVSEITRAAIERGAVSPAPSKNDENPAVIELEDSEETVGTNLQMARLEPQQTIHTKPVGSPSKDGAKVPILGQELSVPPPPPKAKPPLPRAPVQAPPNSQALRIKKSAKKAAPTEVDLIEWTRVALEKTQDPLAKALEVLIRGGAKEALFLIQLSSSPALKAIPQFLYSAAYRPEKKKSLWKGLRWDPRIAPDYWSLLLKKGYFELDPPGPSTLATSIRNVTRGAFGADHNEWLTVFRVGPKEACRGLLAVFSEENLEKTLKEALKLLQQDPTSPFKKNR